MGFDRSVKPSMELLMQRIIPMIACILQHEVDRAAQGGADHDFELRLLMPDGQIKLPVSSSRASRGVRHRHGRNRRCLGWTLPRAGSRKPHWDAAQTALVTLTGWRRWEK